MNDLKKIKIVQINSTCNWGSTGRIAEDINKLVKEQGWQAYIAYGRYELDSTSEKIKIGTKKDCLTHLLMSRITDRSGFYSERATKEFIAKLKDLKPDIVHLHNIHGYYINLPQLFDYLSQNDIPVVWTLHDCWSFTGHCAHFDFIGCNKWQIECYDCPEKHSYPKSLFADNAQRNFLDKKQMFNSVKNLTIVTVSNWLANLVKESFLQKHPIKVVHNGIDSELFRPVESKLKEQYNLIGKRVLLGVASIWDVRKGVDDFIKLSQLIDDDIVIVIIGVSEKLQKKLPHNIIGISRTNSIHELAEWYSTSDVFINLTYEDNFPTTNLEALACGTPVITYRTGGSIEAVSAKTGLIVDKGNLHGVYDSIIEILSNGKSHYSVECRARAEQCFRKQAQFKEYIDIYNEILQDN